MRVALDATPLLGPRTGVGAFCAGALDGLARHHDVDVSAFAVTWRRRHLLGPELPPGVRAVRRSMPARPLHGAWRRAAWPPAEWFVGPADVVHGTNYVAPPTRAAARVVTVHDLTAVRYPELCDGPTLLFPEAVRRAVAEGAWVHTPSRFVAEEVVEHFDADPARVMAVAHGIPVSRSADATDATDATSAARSTSPSRELPVALPAATRRYVLAVGTIEPRKDFPGLVRAFDAVAGDHPDVALIIAGGDGWGSAALAGALEASPFRPRIVRTGYLGDVDLAWLLANATVLAYPSLYEGFGFPPLEAMQRGVPVVATSAGAVPEVVGAAGLLVTPGDVEALAAAIASVLDDAPLRQDLVTRGRDRAREFSWDRCAAGLIDLYRAAATATSS